MIMRLTYMCTASCRLLLLEAEASAGFCSVNLCCSWPYNWPKVRIAGLAMTSIELTAQSGRVNMGLYVVW
uniref:Secreted protein n=1 Tax=Kalanchoe fedtschenkoi TaxID=63787 RepID=A0A7N0ZXD9_KALFE